MFLLIFHFLLLCVVLCAQVIKSQQCRPAAEILIELLPIRRRLLRLRRRRDLLPSFRF